jgi:serine phosphatase RsbU (regulator of sigma subunit)
MMEPKRTLFHTENVRRALLLGVLISAIIAVAVFISVRVYTQLKDAATLEQAFVNAQVELDALLTVQFEQEAAVRGFVAWNKPVFLEKTDISGTAADGFLVQLGKFDRASQPLGVSGMKTAIEQMRNLHLLWRRDDAEPLLKHPHGPSALLVQEYGKVYIDQLSFQVTRIHDLLKQRLQDAQQQLEYRIQQALEGGLASILVFGIIAVVFVASRAQILEVLERESSIVETLQGAFRTDLDALPRSRIGTAYVSADRDANVGGDLFDVRRLDATRGLIMIADMSGKGIEAAVNTAFVKYSIRTLALTRNDPAEILSQFNRIFLDTIGDPNLFVVAFVGIIDSADGSFVYASAGHAGAWLRRGEAVEPLAVTGPIVGLDATFGYENRALHLARGDLIVLATDGLTEARDAAGEILEDEAAIDLLRAASRDPQECADDLVAAVRTRSGGVVNDDLALLVVAFDGHSEQSYAGEAA